DSANLPEVCARGWQAAPAPRPAQCGDSPQAVAGSWFPQLMNGAEIIRAPSDNRHDKGSCRQIRCSPASPSCTPTHIEKDQINRPGQKCYQYLGIAEVDVSKIHLRNHEPNGQSSRHEGKPDQQGTQTNLIRDLKSREAGKQPSRALCLQ